jgi:hypothetical protein
MSIEAKQASVKRSSIFGCKQRVSDKYGINAFALPYGGLIGGAAEENGGRKVFFHLTVACNLHLLEE